MDSLNPDILALHYHFILTVLDDGPVRVFPAGEDVRY